MKIYTFWRLKSYKRLYESLNTIGRWVVFELLEYNYSNETVQIFIWQRYSYRAELHELRMYSCVICVCWHYVKGHLMWKAGLNSYAKNLDRYWANSTVTTLSISFNSILAIMSISTTQCTNSLNLDNLNRNHSSCSVCSIVTTRSISASLIVTSRPVPASWIS